MAITKISPDLVDFDSALVVSPTLTIGDATAEDTKIVFDGNAQDYYIGLDDSADDLIIGKGSTVGTTPAISIDENINSTFAGTITANAGVVVDNITIDGTEIDLSSGDLTLDVAGEINLDADGGKIRFKDGGTEHIRFVLDNTGFVQMYSAVQDADIKIQGNDGGSVIDALVFDMSEAGAATFNAGITLSNDGQITQTVASGGGDYHLVTHTGNEAWSWGARSGSGADDYLDVGISGGTRVMSWHEDGKVGLGHTSPPNRLTVLGDAQQTSSNVYADNDKWGLITETPTYTNGQYVGLIASTTGDDNATKPKVGVWGTHTSAGSKMYLGVSNNYTAGLNVNWALNENGHFGPLASGHGIDFGITSNSSGNLGSEVFNDYEDGTWTPVLIAGVTNPTGGGALAPSGRYTKVGNRVWVTFYVGRSWTNSPSGIIHISGLPYTINASTNGYYFPCVTYNISFQTGTAGASPFLIPDTSGSGTTLALYTFTSGGVWSGLTWQTHAASTSGIYISGAFSYHV